MATTKLESKYDPKSGLITRFVADNTARRVPIFVITSTKLKTVKKLRSVYGFGAAWDKLENGKAKLIRRGEKVEVKGKARGKPAKKAAPRVKKAKTPAKKRSHKAKPKVDPKVDVNPVLAAVIP
jgi:hypothetical protein